MKALARSFPLSPPIVVGLAVAAAAAALGQAPGALRLPLGLLATLFLPGLALAALCFPRADELRAVERLSLGLALSLGWLVLVALGLNLSPWGLRFQPMVLGLTGSTTVLGLLAAGRAWRSEPKPKRAPTPQRRVSRAAVAGGLGVMAIAGLAAVAVANVTQQSGRAATEFYYLGDANLAEAFPGSVTPGSRVSLTVGINNHELRAAGYRVAVEAAGHELASAEAELQPGQDWQQPIVFTVGQQAQAQRLDLLLFENGASTPMRSLVLWLNLGSQAS